MDGMNINALDPKNSSSKMNDVTKENWNKILDQTGIRSSTLGKFRDMENEAVFNERPATNVIPHQDTQLGYPDVTFELADKTQKLTRSRKNYSNERMEQAMNAVLYDKMSLRAAASQFKVPRSSLYDRVSPRRTQRRQQLDPSTEIHVLHIGSGNDIVLPDDKTWVIKSLQDGILTLDDAAFQLGLTIEETKSFYNSLSINRGNTVMKKIVISECEKVIDQSSKNKPDAFSMDDEGRMILDCETVKPRIFEGPVVIDSADSSDPNNVHVDFRNEESPNDTLEEQWHNATMLEVCDLRQNVSSAPTPSKNLCVSTLPYTMLSGLHSWMNALDNDTIRSSGHSAKKWNAQAMNDAIKAVKEKGLSIRKAAVAHGIPKSSLADRLSGKTALCAKRTLGLKKGAMKELKSLAKTQEQQDILKHLKNGLVSFKHAAKELGISYSRMRRLLRKNLELNTVENDVADAAKEVRREMLDDGEARISGRVEAKGKLKAKNDKNEACNKRERIRWTKEDMEKALAAVKEGKMSIRCAAKFYNIPKSTLGDAVTGKCTIGKSPGPKRLLTDEEETALAGWLMTLQKIGKQISIPEVLNTVKAILDKNGCNVPRLHNNLPKTSWWYGFLSRHKEVALNRKDLIRSKKENKGKEDGNLEIVYDNREKILDGGGEDLANCEHMGLHRQQQQLRDGMEDIENNTATTTSKEDHDDVAIHFCASYEDTCSVRRSTVVSDSRLDSLCGLCRKSYNEVDCEETWISCGTIGVDDKLINGCGHWFHVKCTGLANHAFTVDELKDLTWLCPNCSVITLAD
eukprot:gene18178-19992_t